MSCSLRNNVGLMCKKVDHQNFHFTPVYRWVVKLQIITNVVLMSLSDVVGKVISTKIDYQEVWIPMCLYLNPWTLTGTGTTAWTEHTAHARHRQTNFHEPRPRPGYPPHDTRYVSHYRRQIFLVGLRPYFIPCSRRVTILACQSRRIQRFFYQTPAYPIQRRVFRRKRHWLWRLCNRLSRPAPFWLMVKTWTVP